MYINSEGVVLKVVKTFTYESESREDPNHHRNGEMCFELVSEQLQEGVPRYALRCFAGELEHLEMLG